MTLILYGIDISSGFYCSFLSTGSSFQTIAFSFRTGHSAVQEIVIETCMAMWTVLGPEFLSVPDVQTWENIEKEFYERWNFPNCIGAIDGKHIVMQAPPSSGSLYYNYKGTHSIVLMAVVDALYNFILIDVGYYGRNSDGGVLANSQFGKAISEGRLKIPAGKSLPFSQCGTSIPCVIIGDEGFPLKNYLMRPYSGRGLPEKKRIFNYRLSRARRCVENAFGILAHRWRLLRRPIQALPKNAEIYVKACCVLHNFLMKKSHATYTEALSDEPQSRDGLSNLPRVGANNFARDAEFIHDKFAAYFQSDSYVMFDVVCNK